MRTQYDDDDEIAGPSGLVCGTIRRIALAENWRLSPAVLAAILARHRAGSEAARRLLLLAMEHLVWQLAKGPDGWPADHLVPGLWLTLYAAIDRLRDNDIPADRIEKRLFWRLLRSIPSYHLRHHLRWAGREDYPNELLHVPESTLRRKKKERPKRIRSKDPEHMTRMLANLSMKDVRPYKQQTDSEVADVDKRDEHAATQAKLAQATDLAQRIAALLKTGASHRDIASELGLTRYRVTVEIESLAETLGD